MVRAPSFRARKGTLKKRVSGLTQEVDFFGAKWAAGMQAVIDAAGALPEQAEQQFTYLVNKAFTAMKERTPKDTGHARGSWTIGRDSSVPFLQFELGNGVEYIVYLEFGSSKQAPTGMVRVTLNEQAGALSEIARRLRP